MRTKYLKNVSNLSETCSFQIKICDSYFQRTTCAKYLEEFDRQLVRLVISCAIHKIKTS